MARRGAAPVLPLALALAAVAAGAWARGPRGALRPGQGCAALGRCCPGRDPTCAARGPPRCFCDQACGAARDCCADYARVCPGEPPGTRGAGGALRQEWSGGLGVRLGKEGCRPRRGLRAWGRAGKGVCGSAGHEGEMWGVEVRPQRCAAYGEGRMSLEGRGEGQNEEGRLAS